MHVVYFSNIYQHINLLDKHIMALWWSQAKNSHGSTFILSLPSCTPLYLSPTFHLYWLDCCCIGKGYEQVVQDGAAGEQALPSQQVSPPLVRVFWSDQLQCCIQLKFICTKYLKHRAEEVFTFMMLTQGIITIGHLVSVILDTHSSLMRF